LFAFKPSLVTGHAAHLGERRDAHVEIVGPERLRLRALARERAVREAELFFLDVAAPGRDLAGEFGADIREVRADQRRTHRAAVIERARVEHARETVRALQMEFFLLRAEIGQRIYEKLHMSPREVGELRISGHRRRLQHARMHHAHLVRERTEPGRPKVNRRRLHRRGKIRDRLACLAVDDARGRRGLEVSPDTRQCLGDLRDGRQLIRHRISRFAGIVPALVIAIMVRPVRARLKRERARERRNHKTKTHGTG
jgi:hypothetical protein